MKITKQTQKMGVLHYPQMGVLGRMRGEAGLHPQPPAPSPQPPAPNTASQNPTPNTQHRRAERGIKE